MDVDTLILALVATVKELGGPLEQPMTEVVEWYAYQFPTEMLIACAVVSNEYYSNRNESSPLM